MLIDNVKKTIRKFGLLKNGDRVIAGVSGGPDSIALLLILKSLSKQIGFTIHVCHLDHMLRKESAGDAAFVRKLCDKLSVPVTIEKVQSGRLSAKGSVEELARNARLDLFRRVAKKIRATKTALGHNLDDQAETVLMRLIRGSGATGLSGMAAKRDLEGLTIIRPLIETRRFQIERFLRGKRITPRLDRSNFEDIYLRNRLRNQLLPLLEKKYNSKIKEALCNTAQMAAYENDYLENAAMSAARKLGARVPLNKFAKLHPAIKKIVLRLKFKEIKGNTRTLTFKHIEEIEDMIQNRPVNSIVDLTSGISVIKKKDCFFFYIRTSRKDPGSK